MYKLLPCVFQLLAAATLAGGVEGLYSLGGKAGVTIRVASGKAEGSLVGTVASARGERHQPQMNQTVLELRRVGDNAYRGRCSAYHLGVSDDLDAWLDVSEASLAPNGGLRCLVKVPDEGSVQFVYDPAGQAEPDVARPAGTGLEGDWAEGADAILVFRREGDIVVGHLIRQPGAEPAAKDRSEIIRVKPMAEGVYKGTIEFRSADGAKVEEVEDIEIVVRGDTLARTRTAKEGKVAATARRLATKGEKAEPAPKAAPEIDPGDLAGLWRAPNGDTTRYVRNGNGYTGLIVALGADKQGYGFRIGETSVRLRRIAGGTYVGKVLVRTEGGKDFWWDDLELVVQGNLLHYVRYMSGGRIEKGGATRVGGLQDAAPALKP